MFIFKLCLKNQFDFWGTFFGSFLSCNKNEQEGQLRNV
ncbi:hypothetical protein PSPO_a0785 [Pseudoalteromonas spongiae UST010723-006]|nr:hypothetical protein PSPO_a0785 [Pseudoalteromonas spongiae UST010723-006]